MKTSPHAVNTQQNGLAAKSVTPALPMTLADCAHQAIGKYFNKCLKQEAEVLKDTDPEGIHQMRVGMRRLRTALQAFDAAIAIPPEIGDREIAKLARHLGKVRDLDVLHLWFQTYLETSDQLEVVALQPLLKQLQQQRKKRFTRLKKVLKGKQYRTFIEGFETWLAQPQYRPIAALPLTEALPDILLPLVSHLLLHPGWLVATRTLKGRLKPMARMSQVAVNHHLEQEKEALHDLRKQMKRVRYQTECFAEFCGAAYQAQIEEFRLVQDVLGQLQDGAVLSEFLIESVGHEWQQVLPHLAEKLQQEQLQLWKQWQPLQAKYLDPAFRQRLRLLMLPAQPEKG